MTENQNRIAIAREAVRLLRRSQGASRHARQFNDAAWAEVAKACRHAEFSISTREWIISILEEIEYDYKRDRGPRVVPNRSHTRSFKDTPVIKLDEWRGK